MWSGPTALHLLLPGLVALILLCRPLFASLRPMNACGLPMLTGWPTRSHAMQWWRGAEAMRPRLAKVQAQAPPRVLAAQSVMPDLALQSGKPCDRDPSHVVLGSGGSGWNGQTGPEVRGLDQLLAHPAKLGHALGNGAGVYAGGPPFDVSAVNKTYTYPAPDTHRAIRYCETASFVPCQTLTTLDGLATHRVQTGPNFECADSMPAFDDKT